MNPHQEQPHEQVQENPAWTNASYEFKISWADLPKPEKPKPPKFDGWECIGDDIPIVAGDVGFHPDYHKYIFESVEVNKACWGKTLGEVKSKEPKLMEKWLVYRRKTPKLTPNPYYSKPLPLP